MTTIRTETETIVTTGWHRRIKVTHNDHGTYLLLEDGMPDDLRDGPQSVSARLTADESRVIADALTGATDGDCAACSTAGPAFTLSGLADLRARWANETQPYDEGGKLPPAQYRVNADGTTTPTELADLRAALNDALARPARAEDRLARIRDAYEET